MMAHRVRGQGPIRGQDLARPTPTAFMKAVAAKYVMKAKPAATPAFPDPQPAISHGVAPAMHGKSAEPA